MKTFSVSVFRYTEGDPRDYLHALADREAAKLGLSVVSVDFFDLNSDALDRDLKNKKPVDLRALVRTS